MRNRIRRRKVYVADGLSEPILSTGSIQSGLMVFDRLRRGQPASAGRHQHLQDDGNVYDVKVFATART